MTLVLILAASAAAPVLAARLEPMTIPAGASAITVDVDLAAARPKLLRAEEIALDLDGIEADRSPEVYFEVYVHGRDAARGESIGNVALYGRGIRSERRFRPAHVRLVATEALRAALRNSAVVALTFVARGAGDAATPRSVSAVTIARPSVVVVPRRRDPSRH